MVSKYKELIEEGKSLSQAREAIKDMTLSDYLGEATADRMFNSSSSTNTTNKISDKKDVDDEENADGEIKSSEDDELDNDDIDNEIKKIASLAGINETTVSGNIATSPSIVGDTSDSHKPTVQLRRDNREKKEAEDEKKGKSKPKKVSANTSQIFKKVN